MTRLPALALLAALAPASAPAWPSALMESLARDARRLVPRSLGQLLADREREILAEAQRPSAGVQSLWADLAAGRLSGTTLAALDAQAAEALALLRARRVSEGVVKLGALYRIPADLSDPVLGAGPDGYPSGVVREYYAFVSASLDKIPVVLDGRQSLELPAQRLPGYWQGLLDRSRLDAPVIRTELFQNGRVVDHRTLDYRSPVFGVGSLAYSRAVTAIAATWLAVWREARGDLTRMAAPRPVVPADRALGGRDGPPE
ncbi:MAG TPA: hypothetical protein VIG50_02390 [Vicinamibacteria bacterium]